MSLVATDGHRLALITCRATTAGEGRKPTTKCGSSCRARRCSSSAGCSAEGEGDILYERGENHLFFTLGERLLISRMIDGQFPAFERVIPKNNDKHVEFDRDRLTARSSASRCSSNERSRAVKFADRQGPGRDHLEQPGVRRSEGSPDGGLRRRAGARSASTRTTSSISSASSRPTRCRSSSRTR